MDGLGMRRMRRVGREGLHQGCALDHAHICDASRFRWSARNIKDDDDDGDSQEEEDDDPEKLPHVVDVGRVLT